jgi:hypothetical protein
LAPRKESNMSPILFLPLLLLAGKAPTPHPGEIRITIARDPYVSSDQVTVCRVRAINDGSRTWPGKMLRFEARATDVVPAVRERGRFGLELSPHGSLETIIALPGRHDRLEVEWIGSGSHAETQRNPSRRASGRKSQKRSRSSEPPPEAGSYTMPPHEGPRHRRRGA